MRRALLIVSLFLTAVAVAGCGGGSPKTTSTAAGSGSARRLLMQTFDGHHTIDSGVISFDLEVVPRGSSTITAPLELSFSGPFKSAGTGTAPESDFTISVSAQGRHGSLKVISTGGRGYISVGGQSYRMPASSSKSLESASGSLATAGISSSKSGSGSGPTGLAKLGIHPLDWLTDPRIAGSATIAGVATTRIVAGVDASALLHDISRLLGRRGVLGLTGASARALPHSIPAATQRRIARALGTPHFELWTGSTDRVVRKLALSAGIPVTGQVRSLLGGMRSALVTIGFGYSHLNQPQTIAAPTSVKPYRVLRTKVDAILEEIESGLSSSELGGSTSTTASGASADRKYTRCITAARGDVAKMQRCSKLLGGG